MTELGLYLARKSVNRSDVSRRTVSDLYNNSRANLRVNKLYLIALAIEANPCEMLNEICKEIKLDEK